MPVIVYVLYYAKRNSPGMLSLTYVFSLGHNAPWYPSLSAFIMTHLLCDRWGIWASAPRS